MEQKDKKVSDTISNWNDWKKTFIDEIQRLISFLDTNKFFLKKIGIENDELLKKLTILINSVELIDEADYYNSFSYCKILFSSIQSLYSKLIFIARLDLSDSEISNICCDISSIINNITALQSVTHYYQERRTYNSEEYYKQEMAKLSQLKREYEKELSQTKAKAHNLTNTTEKQAVELKAKEDLISAANNKIKEIEAELANKKKIDDIQSEWKAKISETFEGLSSYLNPVNEEGNRLKKLYQNYSYLVVFLIICLIVSETISIWHYLLLPDSNQNIQGLFKNCLPLYIPIPLTGALLWVSITQMNRAQRQLVVIANHIYDVTYIEGLLLSINALTPNVDVAVKRIGDAIDKLLDNHLNINANFNMKEDYIRKEEMKDNVSLDSILKILMQIKGIVDKK